MSGYSTTGTWAVQSGPTLVGPFDGATPALAFAREMRRVGKAARPVKLWSPVEARQAVAHEGTHQPGGVTGRRVVRPTPG